MKRRSPRKRKLAWAVFQRGRGLSGTDRLVKRGMSLRHADELLAQLRARGDGEHYYEAAHENPRRGSRVTHRVRHNPPLYKVEPIGSNQTEVRHGDVLALLSYSTPVAVKVFSRYGVGALAGVSEIFYRTDKQWSNTTARHIASWLRSHGADPKRVLEIPQGQIEKMLETGRSDAKYRGNPLAVVGANPRRGRRYPTVRRRSVLGRGATKYWRTYNEAVAVRDRAVAEFPDARVVEYGLGFAVQARRGGDYLDARGRPTLEGNPPHKRGVRARVLEIRYKRTGGHHPGLYKHAFKHPAWMTFNADGSLTITEG